MMEYHELDMMVAQLEQEKKELEKIGFFRKVLYR